MNIERRPLKTRQQAWAHSLSALLVRCKLTPNIISALSVMFALIAGSALLLLQWSEHPWQIVTCALVAAVGIQLRLLCNMLDGMVAVEGGLKSPTGELWNEVPDRIADSVICVCAGYACSLLPVGVELGWAAALVAMMTAYIRALGGQLGLSGCFHGPMAKPHRMFALTVACIVVGMMVGLFSSDQWHWALWGVLVIIVLGSSVTCVRRLMAVARHLTAES